MNPTLTRRDLLKACGLGSLALTLPNCAASAPDPQLQIWHAYRGAEQRAFEGVAHTGPQAGSKSSPTARALSVPYDAFANKVEVATSRGNGPDLFVYAHDRLGDWAASGLLEPLGFWGEPADLDDFLPATLRALSFGEQLYGLPLAFKTLALYRNLDLAPEAPQSTDDLIAQAQRARQRDAEVWGLGYEVDSLYFHAPWLHGFGGQIFDPQAPDADRLTLDRPEVAASLRFVHDLLHTQRIIPPEATSALVTSLFRQRKLCFALSGPWFRGELEGHTNWAVSPLPVVSATGRPARPLLGVEAAFVSAHSPHKRAAFERALHIAAAGASERLLHGGQLVAWGPAYDRPEAQRDPFIQTFRAQAQQAEALSNRPAMRAVWTPAQRALSAAIVHGADPSEALRTAQATIERSLR